MAQLPNRGGGDTHSAAAKLASIQREEQIVALRLRHVPFSAIGRQLGISKVACIKAFYKSLRLNTKQDIQNHHRSEVADLDLLEARAWQVIDGHKDNWKAVISAIDTITRLHVRRARLLGLDAPTKLDIAAIYGRGTDEASVDRLQRERALAMLPVAEQIRWYEMAAEAQKQLDGTVETTGTVITNGTEHRNDADEFEREE